MQASRKLDFRYFSPDCVRLVEEEVPVRNFTISPLGVPLALGLVLDDSGSQDRTLGHLKAAVWRLIGLLKPEDHAAVVGFARGTRVLTGLTSDKRALEDGVGRLKAYGATALFDGITTALAEVHAAPGKRALLVVSDGADQVFAGGMPLSQDTLPQVIHMARHHRVEVHCVGIGKNVKHGLLEKLARSTGGIYLHAPTDFELMNMMETIAASFHAVYEVTYVSPRAVEDNALRDCTVSVGFRDFKGKDHFSYRMQRVTPGQSVAVSRTTSYKPGTGDLRVFTLGLRDTPLPLRFLLHDSQNRPVRQGFTSEDGFGRLDGHDPELTGIAPGTYRLELEMPGTTLRYVHPGIEVAAGQTREVTYRYSKLVFRRNGQVWYDTPHPYGDSSDLISVKVAGETAGRTVHSGRLIDFKEGRETFLWLEEGQFTVSLDNLWHGSTAPDLEKQILKNRLDARIPAPGGTLLFFDVARGDFVGDSDPVAVHLPPRSKAPRLSDPPPAPETPRQVASRRDNEQDPPQSLIYRPDELPVQRAPAPDAPGPVASGVSNGRGMGASSTEAGYHTGAPETFQVAYDYRAGLKPAAGEGQGSAARAPTDLAPVQMPLAVARLEALARSMGSDGPESSAKSKLEALARSFDSPVSRTARRPSARPLTPRSAPARALEFQPDGILGSQVVGADREYQRKPSGEGQSTQNRVKRWGVKFPESGNEATRPVGRGEVYLDQAGEGGPNPYSRVPAGNGDGEAVSILRGLAAPR